LPTQCRNPFSGNKIRNHTFLIALVFNENEKMITAFWNIAPNTFVEADVLSHKVIFILSTVRA
jgi:hypothetical protein